MLRRRLAEVHLAEELSYVVSQDGESWAMLVRQAEGDLPDESLTDLLEKILWEAWFDACQFALL